MLERIMWCSSITVDFHKVTGWQQTLDSRLERGPGMKTYSVSSYVRQQSVTNPWLGPSSLIIGCAILENHQLALGPVPSPAIYAQFTVRITVKSTRSQHLVRVKHCSALLVGITTVSCSPSAGYWSSFPFNTCTFNIYIKIICFHPGI